MGMLLVSVSWILVVVVVIVMIVMVGDRKFCFVMNDVRLCGSYVSVVCCSNVDMVIGSVL